MIIKIVLLAELGLIETTYYYEIMHTACRISWCKTKVVNLIRKGKFSFDLSIPKHHFVLLVKLHHVSENWLERVVRVVIS